MNSSRLMIGILLAGVLSGGTPVDAASRGARRARQQARAYVIQLRIRSEAVAAAQAQYADANNTLNAANGREAAAAARYSAAITEVRLAADELRRARAIEVDLQKDLADVEHDILSELPEKSAYVRATAEVQALREEANRREMHLLQASTYIAKKAELLAGPEGPAAVAVFRQETLDLDPQYAELQRKIALATAEAARIKRELLADDAEWAETHESLLAARKVTRGAGNDVETAGPGRGAILNDLQEARSAASAARGVVENAESVLGRYQAPATPTKSSARKK